MEKNVGGFERPVRLVVGAILVLAGAGGYAGMVPLAALGIGQALAGVVLVVLGAILLVTGYVQWCPISQALGINTYREAGREPKEPVQES